MWSDDVMGPILSPAEVEPAIDEDGAPFERVLGWKPGYRVNLSRAEADAKPYLDPFRVEPETPRALFAGDERDGEGRWTLTAFLIFNDEAQARTWLFEHWREPDGPHVLPPSGGGVA